MKIEELQKHLEILHVDKDCKYVIFISKASGLSAADLTKVTDKRKDILFLQVDGSPHDLIKTVEIRK